MVCAQCSALAHRLRGFVQRDSTSAVNTAACNSGGGVCFGTKAADANKCYTRNKRERTQTKREKVERARTTWSTSVTTSSFTSYHGQLLSLAVQWGVAIEIEQAIKKSASFC